MKWIAHFPYWPSGRSRASGTDPRAQEPSPAPVNQKRNCIPTLPYDGLPRVLGARGVMVVKDYTTILSMSGDARAEVLAAMREVYDGSWTRNVGTDGGRSLEWRGRIAVVVACTTAY